MRTLYSLLILTAFNFNMCKEKDAGSLQVSAVDILSVSIPDTIRFGQPVPFEVTCGTPTPCWEFSRFEIVQSNHEYTITVLAEYDGRPCIQVVGSFKASSSIVPKERGTHTFRFARPQHSVLDKYVVVH